jgi:hypothetical protein
VNGTQQLFVYADGINFLGDSINTIKENTETLTEAINKCREDKVYDNVSLSELRTEPEYKNS